MLSSLAQPRSFLITMVLGMAFLSSCSFIREKRAQFSSPSPAVGESCYMQASYYGAAFHGHPTANGEIFNRHGWTAAHRTLPFGSILRVTYPKTGRTVTVRINDRGPYIRGRDLDLAEGAAARLGMRHVGVANVRVRRIG